MTAVRQLLHSIPKASFDTFEKYFMTAELIVSQAFSSVNIIKGSQIVGCITDGGNPNPNYATILCNCPTIKRWCTVDGAVQEARVEHLISECQGIADEMIIAKAQEPEQYLGTPDDQRMVESFGAIFGGIHIGTGPVTSGDRVTDLEFIRWRATLFGAYGQIEIEAKKRQVQTAKKAMMCQSSGNARLAALVSPNSGEHGNELDLATVAPASKKLGKKCSNINCPKGARYYAATCNVLWTKCPKQCTRCAIVGSSGGSVHVCENEKCKAVLKDHIELI